MGSIGTHLTPEEEDALWMHFARMDNPVPPYHWVKGLILRELGRIHEPKIKTKAENEFLRKLRRYRARLTGLQMERERLPVTGNDSEAPDGVEAVPGRDLRHPAVEADGEADSGRSEPPSEVVENQEGVAGADRAAESRQERPPVVQPDMKYHLRQRGLFGRRRK